MRSALFVVLLLISATPPALAQQEHGGTVTVFHLNAHLPDRGACVQMAPAVPGTGWACVWKANPLYKELTALLLTAYTTAKSCKVGWATTGPDGHPQIVWAECL